VLAKLKTDSAARKVMLNKQTIKANIACETVQQLEEETQSSGGMGSVIMSREKGAA